MFIPACVALAVSYAQYGSFRQLASPIIAKPGIPVLAFAFFFPIVVIVACAVLGKLLGVAVYRSENFASIFAIKNYPFLLIVMGILAMFGEEYGWRGYLLPELSKSIGPVYATTTVGVVWALWHAPLLYGLAKVMGTGNPFLVATIQMGAVIVFSFPFAYAFFECGSIIPPMIFHYVWNYFNPIVLGNIYRNKGGIMAGNILLINGEGVFGILVGLLFVVWFVSRFRAHP